MSGNSPLIIDPTELSDVLQALPRTPTLNSAAVNNGESPDSGVLVLQYDQHPAHEVPEYATPYHVIPIWSFDSQAEIEARLDDHLYRGLFGQGASGIIPAGFSHWAVWDRAITLTVIFLHPAFVEQVASETTGGNRIELIPKHQTNDPAVTQLGLLLQQDLAEGQPRGTLYRDSLATAFAARLVSNHSIVATSVNLPDEELSDHRLQTVVNYIQDSLDQEIRLITLAELVNLSEYYLCRAFKRSMGISLHQYLIQQRVERAKSLLKRRELTLAEIAQRCGFSSHSHLTRQFKRWLGATPSELRSQAQDCDSGP